MIFADFFKSVAQMGDPRFRRVLLLGMGLSFALLIVFTTGLFWFIDSLDAGALELPIVGQVTWLGDLLSWGALFLMLFLSVFLLVPVASAFTSLFLDDVAAAVEVRHYPKLRQPPPVPFWEAAKDTINFLGVIIVANVLALALYVVVPVAPFVVFPALNGYLLGREYFQLAAMRYEGRAGAAALRKKHGGVIWGAGILMALPLAIPVVNLFIPVLGAATFTHLYHRLARH